jgi:hypothetical protein
VLAGHQAQPCCQGLQQDSDDIGQHYHPHLTTAAVTVAVDGGVRAVCGAAGLS